MPYRLALVTGATSGIGKEMCRLLAGKGINLLITGRSEGELSGLRETLSSLVSVRTYQADLATPEGRRTLITALQEHTPDLVINNAGFGLYGEALTYSVEEQSAILEVNGKATLELSLEAARSLVSQGCKGVILNVSSAAAFHFYPSMAVYAASKAFINQFSQALDYEMEPYGIRVLTICPGMVDTAFQQRAGRQQESLNKGFMQPKYIAEQMWHQIESLQPLKIVDWKYRFLTSLATILPKRLTPSLEKRIIDSRIKLRTILKTR